MIVVVVFIFLALLVISSVNASIIINNSLINEDSSLGLSACLQNPSTCIQTDLGWVQGHINGANVREWTGIQYGKAPIGELRWEDPVSPVPYYGIYEANFKAPGCSQVCTLPPGYCPITTSEDCLYLSVWAPLQPSSTKYLKGYPVHLWIHGGFFTEGAGNTPIYNGTNFALKNIITVVINYRLGALGFLAFPSSTGNYGLKDQRLALLWIKKNIASFGGNPNSITIAGQRYNI